jgi:hypothetical protein
MLAMIVGLPGEIIPVQVVLRSARSQHHKVLGTVPAIGERHPRADSRRRRFAVSVERCRTHRRGVLG